MVGRGWRRGRAVLRVLAGLGVVLVLLAISVVLARFLTVENLERDADLALIQAEARGDVAGMLQRISGCRTRPALRGRGAAERDANPRLRRPGAVKILQLDSATSYSLDGASGRTRLAWTVIGTLPVVQCVQVRRSGNFLTGINAAAPALSPPIPNEADC